MGIFRKQWGVDALYGLVECAGCVEAMGTALSQGIVCLGKQWGVDVPGKAVGNGHFEEKQRGKGVLEGPGEVGGGEEAMGVGVHRVLGVLYGLVQWGARVFTGHWASWRAQAR